MTLHIEVGKKGSQSTEKIELQNGQEITIGRDQPQFSGDPRLSRVHFSILFKDNQIVVQHLSKTNPTYVSATESERFEPIAGQYIEQSSCRIAAGDHRFTLTVSEPTYSSFGISENPPDSKSVKNESWIVELDESGIDLDSEEKRDLTLRDSEPPSKKQPIFPKKIFDDDFFD